MRLGARFAFLSFLLGASGSACNAITGANERMLDPDLGELPDRDTGPDDKDGNVGILESGPLPDTSIPDTFIADADAGPITIVVNVKGTWTSPNGATPTVVANGVKISAMADASNNHPVIFPSPQPAIPSESYTVRATVLTPGAGAPPEFGIMTRVQTNGSAVVLGNVYGAAPPAFLGAMSATVSPWNPSNNASGPTYTYVAGARYKMVVRVIGTEARAKFWISTASEPQNDQIVYPVSPYATGTGVGFYTYFTHDSVLEEMTITVP